MPKFLNTKGQLNDHINIRLTKEEKRNLKAHAVASKWRSTADLVRHCLADLLVSPTIENNKNIS